MKSNFPKIRKVPPSKVLGDTSSAKKPASQRGTIVGMKQNMKALQISTGVSVKDEDRIFSGNRKKEEILQIATDGSLDFDGIETNLSQNQTIPRPSFATLKENKGIMFLTLSGESSRLTPSVFSLTTDEPKSADLNLVIVLARSDLTLDLSIYSLVFSLDNPCVRC